METRGGRNPLEIEEAKGDTIVRPRSPWRRRGDWKRGSFSTRQALPPDQTFPSRANLPALSLRMGKSPGSQKPKERRTRLRRIWGRRRRSPTPALKQVQAVAAAAAAVVSERARSAAGMDWGECSGSWRDQRRRRRRRWGSSRPRNGCGNLLGVWGVSSTWAGRGIGRHGGECVPLRVEASFGAPGERRERVGANFLFLFSFFSFSPFFSLCFFFCFLMFLRGK